MFDQSRQFRTLSRITATLTLGLALNGPAEAAWPFGSSAKKASDFVEVPLERFLIIEANGKHTPYLTAVGGRRTVSADGALLPTSRLLKFQVSGDLAWLKAFDVDKNGSIDRSEFTHAWMVKAAELVSGEAYGIEHLAMYPQTAQLARGTTPDPVPPAGAVLDERDQRLLRNVLDDPQGSGDTSASNPLVETAAAYAGTVTGAGGGSDDGGGDGGGGGGGDSGGGGGW